MTIENLIVHQSQNRVLCTVYCVEIDQMPRDRNDAWIHFMYSIFILEIRIISYIRYHVNTREPWWLLENPSYIRFQANIRKNIGFRGFIMEEVVFNPPKKSKKQDPLGGNLRANKILTLLNEASKQ